MLVAVTIGTYDGVMHDCMSNGTMNDGRASGKSTLSCALSGSHLNSNSLSLLSTTMISALGIIMMKTRNEMFCFGMLWAIVSDLTIHWGPTHWWQMHWWLILWVYVDFQSHTLETNTSLFWIMNALLSHLICMLDLVLFFVFLWEPEQSFGK